VLFDQCMFGAPSRKPTCISTNLSEGTRTLGRACSHSSHETVLIGLDESGGFKTTPAARYPPELCEAMVECFFHELLHCAAQGKVLDGPELHEVLGGALREAPERSSHRAPIRPAGAWIDPVGRWSECFRTMWQDSEVSNVVEARMLLYAIRHASRARHHHGSRILLFTDNLAALSVISRGRSSARSLRFICRGVASYSLGCDIRLLLRWVESRRNHADGPSRQRPLGYFSGPPASSQSIKKTIKKTIKGRTYHG